MNLAQHKITPPVKFDFNSKETDVTNSDQDNSLASFSFSLGLALALFGLLAGSVRFWSSDQYVLTASSKPLVLFGLVCSAIVLINSRAKNETLTLNPWPFAATMLLVFFSDWLCRGYNLFQGPFIRGELIIAGIASAWVLSKTRRNLFGCYLVFSILLLITCFLIQSNGRLIFSDDHATFLFRLISLRENFPYIPFYNPLWNAGIDARDFFATGALNAYFLSLPWLYIFDPASVYNFLVIAILFILTPALTYIAARKDRAPDSVPAIAAILTLCSSLLWFRWSLKYGTMGFITSLCFIPLTLVLTARMLDKSKKFNWLDGLMFGLTFTMSLFWSAAGLVFLPCILLGVLRLKSVLKSRAVVLTLVITCLINLAWLPLFVKVSNVLDYWSAEKRQANISQLVESKGKKEVSSDESLFRARLSAIDFSETLKSVRSNALSANPLIVFLSLPGIFIMLSKSSRLVFGLTAAWLVLLGAVLAPLKPQLDLDRQLVILVFILCIPAAHAISHVFNSLLSTEKKSLIKHVIAATVCAFLVLSPLVSGSIIFNRSVEQYFFAKPIVENLSQAIRSHSRPGRVLFSGFILSDLSGGHIAPLVYFSERPMIASSYLHNKWWYTDVIPEWYRSLGDQGIETYFDLLNVSTIVAHENNWKKYFSSRATKYERLWSGEKFEIYARKDYNSNYFIEGNGKLLDQSSNTVKLKLDGSPRAILKFQYYPFLTSSACKLSPYQISETLNFIELNDCPVGTEIEIKSKPGYLRLFS